jgi:hypothetical protein
MTATVQGAWGAQITNKIVDSGVLRKDKAKGLADYFEHMHSVGQRQRIIDAAVEEMRKFSTSAEIARTLRFAVEVLEGRDG